MWHGTCDGSIPRMIAILPNFLVPRRNVRLTPTARMSCSNAANMDLNAELILRLAKFR